MAESLQQKISPMTWVIKKRNKAERKLKEALSVGNIIRLAGKGSIAGLTAVGLKKGAEVGYDAAVAIQEPTSPTTPAEEFRNMHEQHGSIDRARDVWSGRRKPR